MESKCPACNCQSGSQFFTGFTLGMILMFLLNMSLLAYQKIRADRNKVEVEDILEPGYFDGPHRHQSGELKESTAVGAGRSKTMKA